MNPAKAALTLGGTIVFWLGIHFGGVAFALGCAVTILVFFIDAVVNTNG